MKRKKIPKEYNEEPQKSMPLYTIGIVAELIGTSAQTIRNYEKQGLIKPARRNKNRFYSENDLKWLRCLRDILHNKKISIEGIRKLLNYTQCWELTDCPAEVRAACPVYMKTGNKCWEQYRKICKKMPDKMCENCIVFLSESVQKEKH